MPRSSFWIRLFIAGAAVLLAGRAYGQESDSVARTTAPTPALIWHGFASFGYTRNTNPSISGANGLRVFDDRDAAVSLDVAELALDLRLAAPLRVRIDYETGERIPQMSASHGLNLGSRSDLQQAFLTIATGASGSLDLGKFVTPLGVEVIEGYDGFNGQYSRGLLFNYAIPFTHTGVRYALAVSERTRTTVFATLGWDNVQLADGRWAVGAQLAHQATKQFNLTASAFSGAEPSASGPQRRSVADAIASWTSPMGVVVTAESVVGHEGSLTWSALAAYLATPSIGRLTLTTRAELFDDPDGARLGVGPGARVGEITITPSFALNAVSLLRLEVRHDRANTAAFPASGGSRRSQTTFATNLVIHY